MPAGKGRLVMPGGYSISVSYEYDSTRIGEDFHGRIVGNFRRIEIKFLREQLKLLLPDGVVLIIFASAYNDRELAFRGRASLVAPEKDAEVKGAWSLLQRIGKAKFSD